MRRGRFLIGAVVIAMAVTYLVYAGIRETSVYYLKMDEFSAKRGTLAGQTLRVAGRVKHGTMEWNPRTLDLRFALGGLGVEGDNGPAPAALNVAFNGILPDMFGEGRDVIVEGLYEGNDRFIAQTILTSCPSKYEPEAPAS